MGTLFHPQMILLTGPKHAGKTTVGRSLAHLCRGDFTDLDELVEKQTGKSPRTLYKEAPERFRQAETKALETLMSVSPADQGTKRILAAGGGIIDNAAALLLLKRAGIFIVYLEVSTETAWTRICAGSSRGESLPPFLDTLDPQKTHRDLHQRRSAAYKRIAHITIQAEDKDPEHIGMEIMTQLPSAGMGVLVDRTPPSLMEDTVRCYGS